PNAVGAVRLNLLAVRASFDRRALGDGRVHELDLAPDIDGVDPSGRPCLPGVAAVEIQPELEQVLAENLFLQVHRLIPAERDAARVRLRQPGSARKAGRPRNRGRCAKADAGWRPAARTRAASRA